MVDVQNCLRVKKAQDNVTYTNKHAEEPTFPAYERCLPFITYYVDPAIRKEIKI